MTPSPEGPARGHRPLRVTITGSECTGKTTMAEWLASRYGAPAVPEAARLHARQKGAPLGYQDVDVIAQLHLDLADAAERQSSRILFLDTDLVSTVVYSRHYYGDCPEWIVRAAAERLADLYLLHHPDVPWVPEEGQRDRPHRREEMHALFQAALEELGARVFHVRGDREERRERALRVVAALLGSSD